MTTSYTVSSTAAFTITHARHLAAKVATDLKRIQRFYGEPSDLEISQYEEELIELLRAGYLATVTYGFREDGVWIEPTLRYTSRDLSYGDGADDDPGRVRPWANVSGAVFYSYLTYSAAWFELSEQQKATFRKRLPFLREGAPEPQVRGILRTDRTYSAGGRALDRGSVRAF